MMSWLPKFFLLMIAAFATAGCEIAQKIIDPVKKERKNIVAKVYQKDGVSFSYPDNWKVTEDSIIENDIRLINIEDADNSLFILQVMSSDFEVDLNDHASTFIKELPSKLPVGKVVKVDRGVVSREIAGQTYDGVQIKYSVSVLGETVPHTFDLFFASGVETSALIMIQAPDEDLRAAEKEIQVISDSLKLK